MNHKVSVTKAQFLAMRSNLLKQYSALFVFIALAFSSRASSDDTSKDSETRKKLLKVYAKFQASAAEKLTTIFRQLEHEETCEAGDPNCGTVEHSNASLDSINALDALFARTENLNHILTTLVPGIHTFFDG